MTFYLISSSEAHDIAVRNSVRVILPSSEISAARNKRCKQNITAVSINSGLHRLTFICRRRIASCTAKVTCSSTNDWCHSTRRYNALVYYMYIWSDWMRAPPRSDVTSPRCRSLRDRAPSWPTSFRLGSLDRCRQRPSSRTRPRTALLSSWLPSTCSQPWAHLQWVCYIRVHEHV